MLAIHETAAGLAIVELLNKSLTKDAELLYNAFQTQPVETLVSLKNFIGFESTQEAKRAMEKLNQGKLVKKLKSGLKKVIKSSTKSSGADSSTCFATIDSKLAKLIHKKFKIDCSCNDVSTELIRCISENFGSISAEKAHEISVAELGLAHSIARHTLKFSTDKVDTMVIQAVSLLDTVDKELNSCTQRVKEWYGWHFPELIKIVDEPLDYVAIVQNIGSRENFINSKTLEAKDPILIQLKGILNCNEKLDAIKEAANTSIGLDINEEDEQTIKKLCSEALELAQYRMQLLTYLKQRMSSICPNLTKILGEHCGAKLLAHAGSLSNLAKKAGSTIQILGAEKALFRAIKCKGKTPKYGILYNAPLITQASRENKGKMCRSVAAKAAIAARLDYNQENPDGSFGEMMRQKLDSRAKQLSTRSKKRIVNDKSQRPQQPKSYQNFSKKSYDNKMDATSLQPSAKRPRH